MAGEIDIPIGLIDRDLCMSCPEMEIEVMMTEYYFGNHKVHENRLKCEHYERCWRVKEAVKNSHKEHAL